MPSIDPATGKRFSGNRQRRHAAAVAMTPKAKETKAGRAAEKAFCERLRGLGAPPEDPVAAIVWANRVAALVIFSAATDPESERLAVRRRAVLDGVRALGLTNAKAIDKKLMLRIAERLGLKAKDADGELQPVTPEDPPPLRA